LRRSKLKTGVLGGTFDPIHNAHIMVAEEAISSLDLTEVLFIPTAQTPLKEDLPMSAVEHRVQMVRLAIADNPHFKLSTVEIDRPGTSYTIDTISELRDKLGAENELFFIVGWDSLSQLHRWREPARIVQMCRLVAVPRPGYSLPDLDSLEKDVPGLSQKLIVLDKPEIDISSTSIRERVARGLSIDQLVPPPVADYIKQNRLYLS
jgi:nicotinate-nucleotide adenylyltransferase